MINNIDMIRLQLKCFHVHKPTIPQITLVLTHSLAWVVPGSRILQTKNQGRKKIVYNSDSFASMGGHCAQCTTAQ